MLSHLATDSARKYGRALFCVSRVSVSLPLLDEGESVDAHSIRNLTLQRDCVEHGRQALRELVDR